MYFPCTWSLPFTVMRHLCISAGIHKPARLRHSSVFLQHCAVLLTALPSLFTSAARENQHAYFQHSLFFILFFFNFCYSMESKIQWLLLKSQRTRNACEVSWENSSGPWIPLLPCFCWAYPKLCICCLYLAVIW